MKRLATRIRAAAGGALLTILMVGQGLPVDLVFKDHQYSFQTLRTLGFTASGGADVGEVLKTAYAIQEGNDESWYREWTKTAQEREAAADAFLSRGHRRSAYQEYLKASNYYRTAEFFLHIRPEDPRIVATWQKSRDTFLKTAKLSDRPILPVQIPFEGTSLPGYLCLVDRAQVRRPLLIVQTGFDGTMEELYLETAYFALQRGYNCLLFEGPGQGGVIRMQKLPFRPNWETVVTPVVDYALTLPEVDAEQIVLMGISFGGYLVPRAAAFEKRLRACIVNGGIYDFHSTAHLKPEDEKALDTKEGAAVIDRVIGEGMKANPSLRWSMANGMFTFQAASPSEWLKMTRAYTMAGVTERITCPMLVVDSEGDRDLPGQSKRLYDALRSPKQLLRFTSEEGAEEHCQMGALLISNARILDWLDDFLRQGQRPKGR